MENEISLSNSGLAISNHDVFSQIVVWRELVRNTNMAAVSLFWNTNMAAVTSRENAPLEP